MPNSYEIQYEPEENANGIITNKLVVLVEVQ
jgi:hypothetical protein